jgi:hypothetical protein
LENLVVIIFYTFKCYKSRYIRYSIKDIYNPWIECLESKYSSVVIFEEDYEYDISRKDETKAKYNDTKATIKEYIEIKYENYIAWILDKVSYEYVAEPYVHTHKYDGLLTDEDYDDIDKEFHELLPKIIELKELLQHISILEET